MKKLSKKWWIIFSIAFVAISTIAVVLPLTLSKKNVKNNEKYEVTEEDIAIANNFSMNRVTIEGVSGYTVFRLKNKSLTEIVIPNTFMGKPVIAISVDAFNNNKTITSISIGSNLKKIGAYAFIECSALETVLFDEESQLLSVSEYAFAHCISLTSITIPASVKAIGYGVFNTCTLLQSVIFEEGSQLESFDVAFLQVLSLSEIVIFGSESNVENICNKIAGWLENKYLITLKVASAIVSQVQTLNTTKDWNFGSVDAI